MTRTEQEQMRQLRAEAKHLDASPLLLTMAAICFAINGLESGLRCLREGAAAKHPMRTIQFVRCESGTNIPFERILSLSVFPVNKPPSGQPFPPDGDFNIVARTDDGNYVPVLSKVRTFTRAERINDEICRLLADGVIVAGCKKRGSSTYIYCRKTAREQATITPVRQLKDPVFLSKGEGVLLQEEPNPE